MANWLSGYVESIFVLLINIIWIFSFLIKATSSSNLFCMLFIFRWHNRISLQIFLWFSIWSLCRRVGVTLESLWAGVEIWTVSEYEKRERRLEKRVGEIKRPVTIVGFTKPLILRVTQSDISLDIHINALNVMPTVTTIAKNSLLITTHWLITDSTWKLPHWFFTIVWNNSVRARI